MIRAIDVVKILICALMISSCGSESPPLETVITETPLPAGSVSVIKHFPEDSAFGVDPQSEIWVQFSEAINQGSYNDVRFRIEDEFGFAVPGRIRFNEAGDTIFFKPQIQDIDSALKRSTEYTVHARFLLDSRNERIPVYNFSFLTTDVALQSTGKFRVIEENPKDEMLTNGCRNFFGCPIELVFSEPIFLDNLFDPTNPSDDKIRLPIEVYAYDFDFSSIELGAIETRVFPICRTLDNRQICDGIQIEPLQPWPKFAQIELVIKSTDGFTGLSREPLSEDFRRTYWHLL